MTHIFEERGALSRGGEVEDDDHEEEQKRDIRWYKAMFRVYNHKYKMDGMCVCPTWIIVEAHAHHNFICACVYL